MAKIRRGEVWVVNLEPGFGREMRKKRPALIISNDDINNDSFNIVVVPASSIVPEEFGNEMILISNSEGLNQQSVLLLVLIRSIDRDRLIRKIGKISKQKMAEVEDALKVVLDMDQEGV